MSWGYDLNQEIGRRLDNLRACKLDTRMQALTLEICAADVVTWVNDWCWTYDPRQDPSSLPFKLFPRQVEYLEWRQDVCDRKTNGLTEKSRDMGVTWLNVADQVHRWLFQEGYKGAFGSRKEMLVDRIGDPDSIFEKIRILLRGLPKWMLPKGFDWKHHDNFCKIVNPATGSTLTGEAGDNIGRGGRSSLYDLDEAAFTERPQKIDAALSNNTDIVFYTSSANGTSNLFYRKRCGYRPENIFRFHWTQDPRKDDAWYAEMCEKYEAVTVASEIDIDYFASDPGVYIPAKHIEAAINLDLPDSQQPIVAALDVAAGGSNRTVWGTRQGPTVQLVIDWDDKDPVQSAFEVIELMGIHGASHLTYDTHGVGEGLGGTLAATPDLNFTYTPFSSSGSPSERYWPGEGKTSKEKFYNARAEAWGIVASRLKKTWEHVTGLRSHDPSELMSLPDHPHIRTQLGQPRRKWASNGKMLIESKEEMRDRGIESPDFADMIVYLFAVEPPAMEMMSSGRRRVGASIRH
ncbi:MAG TPA: hypothetical protein V6D06_05230 [Trichocoleus sp.]